MNRLLDLILKHEGFRSKPYRDSVGKLTIAIGRNLDDVGINEEEAIYLCRNDVLRAHLDIVNSFKWFNYLSYTRKCVVICMVFQLGINGFKEFKKMILAIEKADFDLAAKEMLDSTWHKQTPKRAEELSEMMKSDAFPG